MRFYCACSCPVRPSTHVTSAIHLSATNENRGNIRPLSSRGEPGSINPPNVLPAAGIPSPCYPPTTRTKHKMLPAGSPSLPQSPFLQKFHLLCRGWRRSVLWKHLFFKVCVCFSFEHFISSSRPPAISCCPSKLNARIARPNTR